MMLVVKFNPLLNDKSDPKKGFNVGSPPAKFIFLIPALANSQINFLQVFSDK